MTDNKDLESIHERARINYGRIQSAYSEEREQCIDDIRFYFVQGAQWEGPLSDQYENKPKFEINKTHLSIFKIINEYRNNRISVDFVPKKGIKNDKMADVLNGLYRADEKDSCADEAYDNAFEEAVGGGFGAFRLTNQYEDEFDPEDEEQRIMIEPIYEAAKCVYFDLNAKKQDKSDAKYCYVIKSYTHEDYKHEFDDDPSTWPVDEHSNYNDWYTPDVVYVAEYYEVEEKTEQREVWEMIGGKTEVYSNDDFKKDPDLLLNLESKGAKKLRDKNVKVRKIHKYLMSGARILEDLGYIPGHCIPVIPVYGKRLFINNIERCQGHVRLAKDPQRIKNMQTSKLAEISALSSVEKPIFTSEQMAGHENMWQNDNIKNYPYLTVNSIETDQGELASGPLGYTKVPNIPPALAQSLAYSDQDMRDILGNSQQNEEIKSNISGKAVELIQGKIDMQTFIYMSNFSKAIKRCGEVWLSMAKELYVEEEREMKTLGVDDELGSVELQRPILNKDTGEEEIENDISKARMGVTVSVGPSSDSKRQATVNALTQMMGFTQDPETMMVLTSMAMMNIKGEGLEQYRKFFRNKLLQIGAVEPTEEERLLMEQAAQQRQEPTPEEQYFESEAVKNMAQAQSEQAKTAKALAEIGKINADEENTRANTIKTLQEAEIQATPEQMRESNTPQAPQNTSQV